MKEATGELNMTVVTVVAIAAVGAFFYFFIWPGIQAGLSRNTCQNLCPGGELDSAKGRGGVSVNDRVCYCADGSEIEFGEEE